jgi:haloalkane dehalogenase
MWEKPFLCAFSDGDASLGSLDREFLARVPGAKGMPHTTISGAAHFLQEDKGDELAAAVLRFIAVTR